MKSRLFLVSVLLLFFDTIYGFTKFPIVELINVDKLYKDSINSYFREKEKSLYVLKSLFFVQTENEKMKNLQIKIARFFNSRRRIEGDDFIKLFDGLSALAYRKFHIVYVYDLEGAFSLNFEDKMKTFSYMYINKKPNGKSMLFIPENVATIKDKRIKIIGDWFGFISIVSITTSQRYEDWKKFLRIAIINNSYLIKKRQTVEEGKNYIQSNVIINLKGKRLEGMERILYVRNTGIIILVAYLPNAKDFFGKIFLDMVKHIVFYR